MSNDGDEQRADFALRVETLVKRQRETMTDDQKISHDCLVFGSGVGRRRADGTLEHIPFEDVVIETCIGRRHANGFRLR